MPQIDGEREFIGSVTLSTGDTIKVYMPTMGDIEKLSQDPAQISAYSLYALSCGLSVEEFRKLPIPDGAQVMSLLTKYLQAFSQVIGRR